MMVFIHSMFSLELIALVAGVTLLLYIKLHEKVKSKWALFIAWLVIILSILSLICSAFHSVYHISKYGYKDRFYMRNRMMMQDKIDLEKNTSTSANQTIKKYNDNNSMPDGDDNMKNDTSDEDNSMQDSGDNMNNDASDTDSDDNMIQYDDDNTMPDDADDNSTKMKKKKAQDSDDDDVIQDDDDDNNDDSTEQDY